MAEIIKARVWTKIDTLDAWDANPLILGAGEFAPVLTAVGGSVFNFKVGTGDRRFSDLPWSLQTPGTAVAADTSTVFPPGTPGLYVPTENGTYNGVAVDLTVGYVQLIWDGTTLVKVEFPIDLEGYLEVSKLQGDNLFDGTVIEGGTVNTMDGSWTVNPNASASDFIGITEGFDINIQRTTTYSGVAFFTETQEYISRVEIGTNPSVTIPSGSIPAGSTYMRINVGSGGPENWPGQVASLVVSQAIGAIDDRPISAISLAKGNYVPDPTGLKNAANKKYVDEFPRVGYNTFKTENVVEGFRILTSDGTLNPDPDAVCTGFIPIVPDLPFRIQKDLSQYTYIAFYDSGRNFLTPRYQLNDPSDAIVPSGVIPSGAKYIRINISDIPGNWGAAIASLRVTAVLDESSTFNRWLGKKIVINGSSSQVPVYNYIQLAANDLGMILEGNYAIGGTCVARQAANPSLRTPLVDRYGDMSDDADLIVVHVGGNDHNYDWVPYGDFSDRIPTTFYGAMHLLCEGLKNKYVGKTIVIIGGAKRRGNYPNPEDVNAFGMTLRQHVNIQKEVCEYWGCPFLDQWAINPINPYLEADRLAYMPDGTHATEAGHKLISNVIRGFLLTI